MKNVFILNGPPQSGKDAIADYCVAKENSIDKVESNQSLIDLACNISGIGMDEWYERYDDKKDGFSIKDKPWEKLQEKTQREFLIHISEELCKPFLGKNFFVKKMVRQILSKKNENIILVGLGFQEELEYLLNHPEINVNLNHVYRDGCNFDNDSRGYLYSKACYAIYNNDTIEQAGDLLLTRRSTISKMKKDVNYFSPIHTEADFALGGTDTEKLVNIEIIIDRSSAISFDIFHYMDAEIKEITKHYKEKIKELTAWGLTEKDRKFLGEFHREIAEAKDHD